MKKVAKKSLGVVLLIIIILAQISSTTKCLALGDITDNSGIWGNWEPNITGVDAIENKVQPILTAVRVIGIIISVGTLSCIGIKFMLGSVEEKANYKKALVPWTIGAVMIFAITFVPTVIYDMTQLSLNYELPVRQDWWRNYIEGYDTGVEEIYQIYESVYIDNNFPGEERTTYFSKLNALNNNLNNFDDRPAFKQGYKDILDIIRASFISEDEGMISSISQHNGEVLLGIKSAKEEIENGTITSENIDEAIRNALREGNGMYGVYREYRLKMHTNYLNGEQTYETDN